MGPQSPFASRHMSSASAELPSPQSPPALTLDTAEERARLAARTLADALLLGIVGDAILRVPSWGANMTVWSVAIIAAMLTLARRRYEAIPTDARWLLMPIGALSLLFSLRDSEGLVAYNTLALLGTLARLSVAIAQGTEHRVLESRFRELAHSAMTLGISMF